MRSWQWKHKFSSSFTLLMGVLAFGCSCAIPNAHFRLNASHSLPQTLFLAVNSSCPFEKGNIVSIDHPYLKLTVGKIIAGIPGDRILINDQTLFINDKEIGKIQTTSKSGKTYTAIHEGFIDQGCYFVYTPHPESFDSRYAEFGLIREEWIAEVLWPIF